MKINTWKIVGITMLIFVLAGIVFVTRKQQNEKFDHLIFETYSPGTMLSVDVGNRDAIFEVQGAERALILFQRRGVSMTGKLYLEALEGAKYLGMEKGSLVINWQYEDGSGSTWLLENPIIVDPEVKAIHEITVTEIVVE